MREITYRALTQLFNLLMPQFLYWENNNSIYYTELCGLNEIIQINSAYT